MTCEVPGWGTGPYGTLPWGGSLLGSPGGPIPSDALFSLFCVGPCGPMQFITTYNEVAVEGDGSQFLVDPVTLDQTMVSGGSEVEYDARLSIDVGIPSSFTLDFTLKFVALPPDFSDIVYKHVFVGAFDGAGPTLGLFFSKAGIKVTGSIHHTGGPTPDQNLVLDAQIDTIPGSVDWFTEGEYYSIRIAVDGTSGTFYLFITKTVELLSSGHQLRFVGNTIPATECATSPSDQVLFSVRGTASYPSNISLDTICAAPGLVIPNLPPIADAGPDQAVRFCSIVRLDGSRSFDPEGAPITYRWRLIDAPRASQFMLEGHDGKTYTGIGGVTARLFSETLYALDQTDPIQLGAMGDVLVISGTTYTILAKGYAFEGFFVQVDVTSIPDNLTNAPFQLFRQRGISNPTEAHPTLFPDVPGFYRFDLTVSDATYLSERSQVFVNVVDGNIPRGCVPNMAFIWGYLSNFWLLVQGTEVIESFWSATTQVIASELLTLWQHDYAKSLRDVPRTFLRKWLSYPLKVSDPTPALAEFRFLWSGIRHLFPLVGLSGIPGTSFTVNVPLFEEGLTTKTKVITFSGSGVLTAKQVRDQLTSALKSLDSRFSVVVTRALDGSADELLIVAPFHFEITGNTSPILSGTNETLSGTGSSIGTKTYRVDRALPPDVRAGDLLVLGDVAYLITAVATDSSDIWPRQRVTLSVELPIGSSTEWAIRSTVTSASIDFEDELASGTDRLTFHVVDGEDEEVAVITTTGAWPVGTKAGIEVGLLANYALHPTAGLSVEFSHFFRLQYVPVEEAIVDIPFLQEIIKDPAEEAVLRRNVDFSVETVRGKNAIRFYFGGFGSSTDIWQDPETVPELLWAEFNYLDNSAVIEANFGAAVELTRDQLTAISSSVDYLSAVRGLWYARLRPPTLKNLRIGTQILVGLPFSEEDGTIEEIRTDFSPTQGRILVKDTAQPGVVRSYSFPASLVPEMNPATGVPYKAGDAVSQFAPLVTGAEIIDYVKDPNWIVPLVEQGAFFEVEKFYRFMVRVDSAAFSLASLSFVQGFIRHVKPEYTLPIFVVRKKVDDTTISVADTVSYAVKLQLFDGACFGYGNGVASIWDEPDPSDGGAQSHYDDAPNFWGFDRGAICPEDYIEGKVSIVWAGGTPTFDSIFAFDQEIYDDDAFVFEEAWVTFIDGAGSVPLLYDATASGSVTLTDVTLTIFGDNGISDNDYNLILAKNGSDAETIPFTFTGSGVFTIHDTISISVVASDVISARIEPDGATDRNPFWKVVQVRVGASVSWDFDTALPAGTYAVYKVL